MMTISSSGSTAKNVDAHPPQPNSPLEHRSDALIGSMITETPSPKPIPSNVVSEKPESVAIESMSTL